MRGEFLPSLVLDTNTLAHPGFLAWLRETQKEAWLPAVAFMEACYHTRKRRRSVDDLLDALDAAGIEVVAFDEEQAAAAAAGAVGRWDFAQKARDYAIGALARTRSATMVTENKRDFSWLPDVKSSEEAMTST